MTARTFKSRLLSGASSAFVCSMAVAGFMAVQAVTTEASASLNGYFTFTVNAQFDGLPGHKLSDATFIALTPTQNDVGVVPAIDPVNSVTNNFYAPGNVQTTGFSVFYQSHVSLTTGLSAVSPDDGENYTNVVFTTDDSGFPLFTDFLTFSFTSPDAPGTTPQGRFTYSISSITWEGGTKHNTMTMESAGYITDSQGKYSGQLATLNAAFTTSCGVTVVECETAVGAFTFEVPGDGNVQHIPEPVTMTAFGLGVAGLMAARRRRA